MPTPKKPSKPGTAEAGGASAKKTTRSTRKKAGSATRKKAGGSTRRKKKLPDGMSMEEMTRVRAFEIWEARQASDADDWDRAEAEVRSEYRQP